MACCHDDLVHLIQYFRGEVADIILQCLYRVRVRTVRAVAKHLSKGAMFIGKLSQTVEVAVSDQPE